MGEVTALYETVGVGILERKSKRPDVRTVVGEASDPPGLAVPGLLEMGFLTWSARGEALNMGRVSSSALVCVEGEKQERQKRWRSGSRIGLVLAKH